MVLSEVLKEADDDCDGAKNSTTDSALMFVCGFWGGRPL